MADLAVEQTPIPGLLVLRLDVRTDDRGWFDEAWQRAKMTALGLPDFGPVQANVAYNARRGTTRGLHAEPWDKLVTVASGAAYAAWVDLRADDSFGTTYAVAPRARACRVRPAGRRERLPDARRRRRRTPTSSTTTGVPSAAYVTVDLADPALAIDWPIPPGGPGDLREGPHGAGTRRRRRRRRAPRRSCWAPSDSSAARCCRPSPAPSGSTWKSSTSPTPSSSRRWPWTDHDVVLNAAAYTAVDRAETTDGRRARLDRQRRRSGLPGPTGRPPRFHAGALLDRLRLRRDTRGARRGRAVVAARRLRPVEGRGRRDPRGGPAALPPAHVVGGRRRRQLRTHDGAPGRRGGHPVGGVRPDRPADLHRRARASDTAPARERRAVRHLPRDQRRPADVVGRRGARGLRGPRSRSGRRAQRSPPRSTPPGGEVAPRPASSVLSTRRIEATGFEPRDALEALRAYASSLP